MVSGNIIVRKINTSMNLDQDLLKRIDSQIAKKKFVHRTHAVEYALQGGPRTRKKSDDSLLTAAGDTYYKGLKRIIPTSRNPVNSIGEYS
jgi:Arc/MetJ-type ribon-helix-helix transcriptional regulator